MQNITTEQEVQLENYREFLKLTHRFKIKPRKDGTYYAVLSEVPTAAEHACQGGPEFIDIYNNRSKLIEYVRGQLNDGKNPSYCLYTKEGCLREAVILTDKENVPAFDRNHIVGMFSKLRIVEVKGRTQLHAEYKHILEHYDVTTLASESITINPALIIDRCMSTGATRDVKSIVGFFFETVKTDAQFLEFLESLQVRQEQAA